MESFEPKFQFCDDGKMVCRGLEEVLNGILNPVNTWMWMLELPDHPQWEPFKDRAFPVLLVCLRDMIEAKTSKLNRLKMLAEKVGRSNLYYGISAFEEICEMPIAVFERLEEREQILMFLARDRLVHGYLGGFVADDRTIKVVSNKSVIKRRFSKAELRDVIGNVETISNHHIADVRQRVMDELFAYASKVRGLDGMFQPYGGVEAVFASGAYLFRDKP
ncbi:hypothetical protein [Sulfitobacter sp.]|uniref:hypothetical protein n=1 Tax=Sulfitobacter sp. TaxID=1903071 RepID=UPI003001E42F